MDNIFYLNRQLLDGTYQHGPYHAFKINDPKPRDIHKALVRDRLLHHALYRKLYAYFDRTWIADSYSCRNDKGSHRAMDRFRLFALKVSQNNTKTCYILKCDIRKFFASIDHDILFRIIVRHVPDTRTFNLIKGIVRSFESTGSGKGLPLGNLTSQLLVNVYMNELDQFVKHHLKAKYYIRYADDFVFLSTDRTELEKLLPEIVTFLSSELKLEMHPDKVYIKTFASGVDFLGWIHFPSYRLLRAASRKRMVRNLKRQTSPERIQSYRGMLSHGNAHKLSTLYLKDI